MRNNVNIINIRNWKEAPLTLAPFRYDNNQFGKESGSGYSAPQTPSCPLISRAHSMVVDRDSKEA
jgi:hypothetical protein